MSNEIQQFDFKGTALRTLTDEAGEPWFVAKDVCDILGLENSRKATAELDSDEKNTVTISDGIPGNPNKTIISEPGLYKLIMRSRKPEAKEFQRWVTHEVLPSIRKHGAYMTQQTLDKALTSPDFLIQLATKLKEEQEKVKELEPKARFADAVAASDGTCLIGELAKMLRQNGLDIGQNRLFAQLREDGYLGKTGSNRNVPTQRAMDLGLFRIKETAITHSDGHVTINRTAKCTGKGQTYFINRYCPKTPND
jgi:anti-repressor protein